MRWTSLVRTRPLAGRTLRWRAASVAALLAGGMQWAAAAPLTCQAGTGAVPVLDPAADAAELGPVTLACAGGAASDPPVLGVLSIFFNAPLLTAITPWVSIGNQQIAGSHAQAGLVQFVSLPISPFETDLQVHNLWVDPSAQAPGFGYLAFLSLSVAPVADPQQVLARVGEFDDEAGDGGQVSEPSSAWLALAALGLCARGTRRKARRGALRLTRRSRSAREAACHAAMAHVV